MLIFVVLAIMLVLAGASIKTLAVFLGALILAPIAIVFGIALVLLLVVVVLALLPD